MKQNYLKIAIAEPSVIIRGGISKVLSRINDFRIQNFEIETSDVLFNYLKSGVPDVLILNPVYWPNIDVVKLKCDLHLEKLKVLAITSSAIDVNLLKNFDGEISLFDNIEQINSKLHQLFTTEDVANSDDYGNLTPREREIIIAVVKGMTNKEIADSLSLSAHTVISHRRNIARKLEIHSTAGLTIYAIVNKLVDISDVRKAIY